MGTRDPIYTQSGIATAIACAFVGGLIVGAALYGGLAGLQAWQTIIAASIALLAACVAYGNTSRQILAAGRTARMQLNEAALRRLSAYQIAVEELYGAFTLRSYKPPEVPDSVADAKFNADFEKSALQQAAKDEAIGRDRLAIRMLLDMVKVHASSSGSGASPHFEEIRKFHIEIGAAVQRKKDILLTGGSLEYLRRDEAVDTRGLVDRLIQIDKSNQSTNPSS